MLRECRHQELQDIVDAQLLEQESHAVAGHRDGRVGRWMDKQLVGGPEAEPDGTSTFVRNVNWPQKVPDQVFESNAFTPGTDEAFAARKINFTKPGQQVS